MAEVKVTFRVLASLRDSLKAEAEALGVSINELAVMKLSQPLPANSQQAIDTRHDVNLLSQISQQTKQLDQLLAMVASIMPATMQQEPASGLPATSVCVERLTEDWFLKKSVIQKDSGTTWRVFATERVVAIEKKSANGSQHWLEVWKQYPDTVWDAVGSRLDSAPRPVSVLEDEHQLQLAKSSHPKIQEAKARGWVCKPNQQRYSLEETVEIAEEYLADLEADTPKVLTTYQLAERCCQGQSLKAIPSTATTLSEMRPNKLPGWFTKHDPDKLAWSPNEDRTIWTCQQIASIITK
jgi:hypothetical protein